MGDAVSKFWEDGVDTTGSYVERVKDNVNHPSHYTSGKIEVWDFIIDQDLDYLSGNAIKYICRCGKKKDADKTQQQKSIEDLEKAIAYLNKKIEVLKSV